MKDPLYERAKSKIQLAIYFAKSIPNYELRVIMRLPMVMTIVITAGPWKNKSFKIIPERIKHI